MSELKPCPFCGSKAHTSLIQSMWFVECDNKDCGALMGFDAEKVSQEEAISAWNRRAQPANEPLTKISEMLEQAAQDMDDKCRQWQCVLQRVHDAGTFDQNSGLWTGIDKEHEAKAQASFGAYRYALEVIDKIAEHVSNSYKPAAEPLTCAGYDIDGLMITAELLRKYDVRPENLLDLCKNMKSCYEMVQRAVEDSFKRAMMQATGVCPNSDIDAHKPGGEQDG